MLIRRDNALLTLLFFGVSLTVWWGIYRYLDSKEIHYLAEIEAEATYSQALVEASLKGDWYTILSDITLLSQEPHFQSLLDLLAQDTLDNSQKSLLIDTRMTVRNHLNDFIHSKPIYHKIRLINTSGQEVVVMHRKKNLTLGETTQLPALAPDENDLIYLQDKHASDYFIKTMTMSRNEVYISPLDLNKEFGRISKPHIPTIRIAKPILDRQGRRLGIVVLSYDAEHMLNKLRILSQEAPIELVDPNGYWIYNKKEQGLLDFEFSGHQAFKNSHPEAWNIIQFSHSGFVDTADNLYYFRSFLPLHRDTNSQDKINLHYLPVGFESNSLKFDKDTWKIIVTIDRRSLTETFLPQQQIMGTVGAFLETVLVMLFLLGLTLNARKRREEQERKENAEAQSMYYNLQEISYKYNTLEEKITIFLNRLLSLPWLAGTSFAELTLHHRREQDEFNVVATSGERPTMGPCHQLTEGACPARELAVGNQAYSVHVCETNSTANHVYLCFQIKFDQAMVMLTMLMPRHDPLSLVALRNKKMQVNDSKVLTYITNTLQLLREFINHEHTMDEYRKFQRIVEQSPVSVVMTDIHGRIQYVNNKFTLVSGYTQEESLASNPRVLKSGQQPPTFYETLWHTITAGREWQGEFCNKRKDGTTYWEKAKIFPLRNASGTISNFVAIKEDISVHKREQEERQELERQLRQAQKMESLGHLTGGIAHDFNNILAAIKGFGELAIVRFGQDEKSKLHYYLRNILTAAERARDLISQMLLFSRSRESTIQRVSIEPLVKEVVKLMRATLPSSISIVQTFVDHDLVVEADPVQLHQILMNLFVNARDAMEGKGRLDVRLAINHGEDILTCSSCHTLFFSQGLVTLAVQDDGPGIPEENQQKIFEPFYTTKEVGKGTGMGLSVVHGILHNHNAHVVLDSAPGRGTTFNLYFPSAANKASVQEVTAPICQTQVALAGKVLLVDDESLLVELIKDVLEEEGLSVIALTSSVKALAMFRSNPAGYDLVVTDQTMPEMTGLDMIHAMHAMRPELPVILCTGYSKDIHEGNAAELGVRCYIRKPIDFDQLRRALGAIFRREDDTP